MKRLAGVAVALLVTGVTLLYAVWGMDPDELWRTLAGGRLWVVGPFLLLLAVFYYTNAQRWGWMLARFGCFRPLQLLPSMMIGFAANNVLPLRVGELIRAYLLARDYQLSRSGVVMTLVLERLLDLVGILSVFVIGMLLVTDAPAAIRSIAWIGTAAVLGLATLLGTLLFLPERIIRLWLTLSDRAGLPGPLRRRGSIYLEEFEKGLAAMREPRLAILVLTQSVARWFLPVLLAWLCIHAYSDLATLPAAMITIGVTAFALALPSAPGFVGPIQAAFVFSLSPFGVSQEAALAASIMFLLGHWMPVTAAGAALLAARHLSLRELASRAEDDARNLRLGPGPERAVPRLDLRAGASGALTRFHRP